MNRKYCKLFHNIIVYVVLIPLILQGTAQADSNNYISPPSIFSTTPLVQALERALEATFNDQPIELEPVFKEYIDQCKEGILAGYVELAMRETVVFLSGWKKREYPSIEEKDLKAIIEKIVNNWARLYKSVRIEEFKVRGTRTLNHFSLWDNPCCVRSLVFKDGHCYLLFNLIDREMAFRLLLDESEYDETTPTEKMPVTNYGTFMINKLLDLKGEKDWDSVLHDPLCRECMQEIIDGRGWETMVFDFSKNRDYTGLSEEGLETFLEKLREEVINDARGFIKSDRVSGIIAQFKDSGIDPVFGSLKLEEQLRPAWQEWRDTHRGALHIDNSVTATMLGNAENPFNYLPFLPGKEIFKCAYPPAGLEGYDKDTVIPVRLVDSIGSDLAEETILILKGIGEQLPRVNSTLIENLIKRIRDGKVLFGRHFLKAAAAVETHIKGEADYCILVNNYMQSALNKDQAKVKGISMRGLFLASILLGQEAQIYLRQNKNTNWDDPEYIAAYTAQVAELQVLTMFRNNPGILDYYSLFLTSLDSNFTGELNLTDTMEIHTSVVESGIDYDFLENRTEMFLLYKDVLTFTAFLPYSGRGLSSGNVMMAQELFQEIGLCPLTHFSDIPPRERPSVIKVEYPIGVDRANILSEDELIKCLKKTLVPVFIEDSRYLLQMWYFIDRETFSEIIIKISPQAKKVDIKVDIHDRRLIITIPEISDAGSWIKYCDSYKGVSGEAEPLIDTDVFKDLKTEMHKDKKAINEAKKFIEMALQARTVKERTDSEIACLGSALNILQNRLRASPGSFELVPHIVDLMLDMGKVKEAQGVIHKTLRNPGLYSSLSCGYLLNLIRTEIKIILSETESPDVVSDCVYLADIAKKEKERRLQGLSLMISRLDEDIKRLRKELGEETPLPATDALLPDLIRKEPQVLGLESIPIAKGDERDPIRNQLYFLEKIRRQLKEEMQMIDDYFAGIADYVAEGCYSYVQGMQWLDGVGADNEFLRLLLKIWRSFAKGEKLTDDEIEAVFSGWEKRQKKDPLDFSNLFYRGKHLYMIWKHQYPDRRQYLEEAEKRFEQYIAYSPIDKNHMVHCYYLLGLIKYHLGKNSEAEYYLAKFAGFLPTITKSRIEFTEGLVVLRKLRDSHKEDSAKDPFETVPIPGISISAINELLEHYLEPFIMENFDKLDSEKRRATAFIYLEFLRRTKQLEKAYKKAKEWLEKMDDIDIIMKFVKIGAMLNREDEVKEFMQVRFASSKNRELLLGLCEALFYENKEELVQAFKILNSLMERYRSKQGDTVDKQRRGILVNLYVERAVIFEKLGQFMLAKRDWNLITKHGWKTEAVCKGRLEVLDILDGECCRAAKKIFDETGEEYGIDTAIGYLDEELKKYPHHYKLLNAKYIFMSERGQFSEVEKAYQSLLEIYPGDYNYQLGLASCALAAENPKAYDYYMDYIKSGGDIKPERRKFGKACFLAGRWEECIRHLMMYIDAIPLNANGEKHIEADSAVYLLVSYMKLKKWEDAYTSLTVNFCKHNVQRTETKIRRKVFDVCKELLLIFLASEKPDWEKIRQIRDIAWAWADGPEGIEEIQKLDEEIELRKLKLEEEEQKEKKKRTEEETRRQLNLKIKKISEKLEDLKNESKIFTEERIKALENEIGNLLASAEKDALEINNVSAWEKIEGWKRELPRAAEKARERLHLRNEEIEKLKGDIKKKTDDLLSEKDVSQDDIDELYSRARQLYVHDGEDVSKLLADLRTAKEMADKEREKKRQQRRLDDLKQRFKDVESKVNLLVLRLQALPPKQDPQPVLDEYRAIICGFFGIKDIMNLRDILLKQGMPEVFIEEVIKLDNYFRGKYGQTKGRRKLEAKQAFEQELHEALSEMETIPIEGGLLIGRQKEIHDRLIRPMTRVLDKYSELPDFRLKYTARRRAIEQAERKIAVLISEAEKEREAEEERNSIEAEERERAAIRSFFTQLRDAETGKGAEREKLTDRKKAIQDAIDEWSGMIKQELSSKKRKDIDFEAIREKGKELAEQLEEKGVFLTYEEAFFVQLSVYNVLNPNVEYPRFSWISVFPVIRAVSMSDKDRPRALAEVNACFDRPKIEDVDEKVYDILTRNPTSEIVGYMGNPSLSVKKLFKPEEKLPENPVLRFKAYWCRANETWQVKSDGAESWSYKYGCTGELIALGIIKDPEEIFKLQIHLLREIYTDDPDEQLDPKSPDYPEKVALAIVRKFSGENLYGDDGTGFIFLHDLRNTRLKLVPRCKPSGEYRDSSEFSTEDMLAFSGCDEDAHRILTADETRNLILLAQKGNPIALKVLQAAHVITVKSIVTEIRERNRDDFIPYGFLGFLEGVFHYGFTRGLEGRNNECFRLHRVSGGLLDWVKDPVKRAVKRSEIGQKWDVNNPTWLKEKKKVLERAREQVLIDVERLRSLFSVVGTKNLEPDLLRRIALSCGLKPLEVLAFLTGCEVSDLYEMAGNADRFFNKIVREKSKDWRKRKTGDFIPIARVLLGGDINEESLSGIWWIERMSEDDLQGKRPEEVFIRYIERVYELNLHKGDLNNDVIAPAVSYIISMPVDRQFELDSTGVRRPVYLDAPVGDDSETEMGEIIDLSGYTGQKNPHAEIVLPAVSDIMKLDPGRLNELATRVSCMLDKLGKRILGGRTEELSELRPVWQKAYEELEQARAEVRMIEEKLEEVSREERKALGHIIKRIEDVKRRCDDKLRGILADQNREMMELQRRHGEELTESKNGSTLTEREKTTHWYRVHGEVTEHIRAEKAEIDREYEKTKRLIEERSEVAIRTERLRHEGRNEELNQKITNLKNRHTGEIESHRLGIRKGDSDTEETEMLYPDPPEDMDESIKGSVPFDKELWDLILKKMDSISINDLLTKLDSIYEGEKREQFRIILKQLIEKSSAYDFSGVELICRVFVYLSFNKRIWEFIRIEAETNDIKDLNIKLNRRTKEVQDTLSSLGLNKDDVSGQLSVLARINEKYKAYKKAGKRKKPEVTMEQLLTRHKKELEDLEGDIVHRRNEENELYRNNMAGIETNKKSALDGAGKEYQKALADLGKEREEGLREAREKHERWKKASREQETLEKHKTEIERMERRQRIARGKLEPSREEELKPLLEEYNSALEELDRRMGEEMAEIEDAMKRQESEVAALKHDKERILRAIAQEKERLLRGDTEDDRLLSEIQRLEWEDLVSSINSEGLGILDLNGYGSWDRQTVEIALGNLRQRLGQEAGRLDRWIAEFQKIKDRQEKDEKELRERQRKQIEELDRVEKETNGEIERSKDELAERKVRLFRSKGSLNKWLEEEKVLLREREAEFLPLNQRYQLLEGRRKSWERAKFMYLDHIGLSLKALKARHPLTLEDIAKDPEYAKEDGTPITRERVRQILKPVYIQLLVFDDFDDVRDVSFFAKPKDIRALLAKLNFTSPAESKDDIQEKADDWGRYYLSRSEILQLIRTIIEAQDDDTDVDEKVSSVCIEILRRFIYKNQTPYADVYKIIAEMAQQLIDAFRPDEAILWKFEEKIGEMRIKLLKEPQMGSSESLLKPYNKTSIEKLERRFSYDYNPETEFPYFPVTDKNWFSRDEIICLGITWNYNPILRQRIVDLLNKFIDEQDDMYPDSGVQDMVVGLLEEAERIFKERQGLGADKSASTGVVEALKRKCHGDLDYETVLKPAIKEASDEKRYIAANSEILFKMLGIPEKEGKKLETTRGIFDSGRVYLIIPKPGTVGLAYNSDGIQAGHILREEIGDFKEGSVLLDWGIINELLKVRELSNDEYVVKNAAVQILALIFHELDELCGMTHKEAEGDEVRSCGVKRLDLENKGDNSNSRLDDTLYVIRQLLCLADRVEIEIESIKKTVIASTERAKQSPTQIVISLYDWNELYIFRENPDGTREIAKTIRLKDYVKPDVLELFKSPLMIHIDTRGVEAGRIREAVISGLNIAVFNAVMESSVPSYRTMTGRGTDIVTFVIDKPSFVCVMNVMAKDIKDESLSLKGASIAENLINLENFITIAPNENNRLGVIEIDSALLNNASHECLELLYSYLVKIKKEDCIAVKIIDKENLSIKFQELVSLLNELSGKSETDERFRTLRRNKDNYFILVSSKNYHKFFDRKDAKVIQMETSQDSNPHILTALTISRGIILAGGIKKVDYRFVIGMWFLYISILGDKYKGQSIQHIGLDRLLDILLPPMPKAEWESFDSVYNGLLAIKQAA